MTLRQSSCTSTDRRRKVYKPFFFLTLFSSNVCTYTTTCRLPNRILSLVAMAQYNVRVPCWRHSQIPNDAMDMQKGEKVEYRPIGGQSDNVTHSTGVIENVEQDAEGVS